jgi:hypothetical protein
MISRTFKTESAFRRFIESRPALADKLLLSRLHVTHCAIRRTGLCDCTPWWRIEEQTEETIANVVAEHRLWRKLTSS